MPGNKELGEKWARLGGVKINGLGKMYMAHLGTWGFKTHFFGVVLRESERVFCKSARVLNAFERFWRFLEIGMCRFARGKKMCRNAQRQALGMRHEARVNVKR